MSNRTLFIVASFMGFSAVAMGAFGAHALKEQLESLQRVSTWSTAAHYHLVHAVALFALAVWRTQRKERVAFSLLGWFWTLGIILFSGSLYILSMGAPDAVGAITPIGGLFFMAGWVTLGVMALRDDDENSKHLP